MSGEFYVLTSMKKTGLDNIVIEPADATGTRWGAYTRVKLAVGDVAGYYLALATLDSSHARNSNMGLTKADKYCHLIVINQGHICLVASKTILPEKALLTRYGFKHRIDTKWPLPLLEARFGKYTAIVNREDITDKEGSDEDDDEDTITIEQVASWQSIIDKKKANTAKHRAIYLISIFFADR
jgi:hypothetical protein